jgi:hypothetical protein
VHASKTHSGSQDVTSSRRPRAGTVRPAGGLARSHGVSGVLARIESGDESSEAMVPPIVAEVIKAKRLFL